MSAALKIAKGLDANYRASGNGYVCKCPVHDDQTASLTVSDGEHGKPLVHCHAGCNYLDVIGSLRSRNLWPEADSRHRPRSAGGHAVVANDNHKASKSKSAGGKIVKDYDYLDRDGAAVQMRVCRREPKGFFQCRPDPNRPGKFINSVNAEHRILYNAPNVVNATGAVLVVEGEKDVDNLTALGVVATCNPGGAGKWQDNFSEMLRDKDVILVPDNDEAGRNHADLVSGKLQGIAKRVRILHLPNLPAKGDISDWLDVEGNNRAALNALLKAAPEWKPPVPSPREPEPQAELEPWEPGQSAPAATADFGGQFTPLGYNKGTFYYIGGEGEQIVELSGSGHTKGNLLMLAPLWFWTDCYAATKGGFDVDAAADAMMRACYAKGMFSVELMRGRGAWWDDGRIILHCGDRVYVDGRPMAPAHVPSRFVYERGKPMRADIDHPLELADATRFLDLVKMMPWSKPIDALFVAGWCALAHVGGVLSWRPHIWVVGAKGSGKSHVMSNVIKPILGDACLFVAGNSSEAGIRQRLAIDAIPVLFDEAEGEDQRAHDRLQSTLALVRQSSSETGAELVKGTTGGKAMSFQIRSCFAFSSINANLVQQSDRSRVTVVELEQGKQKPPGDPGCFTDILKAEAELMTKDFVQRFHARAIAKASVIRESATVFAKVVAAVMEEQRAGDQIGTLLAGAWSLQSDKAATYDEAKAFVEAHDWSEAKAEAEGMKDEDSCLQHILQSKQRVTLNDKQMDLTVGELIQMGQDYDMDDFGQRTEDANKALGRIGIRLLTAQGCYYVANKSKGLQDILKGTPWQANWGAVLKRIKGAEVPSNPIYFGFPGSLSRAVRVPFSK